MGRDQPGLPPAPARLSSLAYALGTTSLAAVLIAMNWLVLRLCGFTADAHLGVQTGLVLGLASLAAELAIIDRSTRSVADSGVQSTLTTFGIRMAVVAPFTSWFSRAGVPVDARAFALAFCSTFFVYLCWLTWKTATAPVSYRRGDRRVRHTGREAAISRRLVG